MHPKEWEIGRHNRRTPCQCHDVCKVCMQLLEACCGDVRVGRKPRLQGQWPEKWVG